MPNAFIRKLNAFNPLSDADRQALERLCTQPRDIEADQELVREGDLRDLNLCHPGRVCLSIQDRFQG